MAPSKKHPSCPYCGSFILGAFTVEDHFYSHSECGRRAITDKLVPKDFLVSQFILV